jgi:hypothetical protein
VPRSKISAEKQREYARTYRAKHPEKFQSAEYKAYKNELERKRRQTPEYKKHQKLWREKRRTDRSAKSSLKSEYVVKLGRRRLLCSIVTLERFWSGESYEYPFGIGHHFGIPPEDLSAFINGRQSIFVKRLLDEPFTGAGIYSELVEELRWRADQENMEMEKTKKILATRIAKEKQEQRFSVKHWLQRQKEYLEARLTQIEKEKQAFYDSLGPHARAALDRYR